MRTVDPISHMFPFKIEGAILVKFSLRYVFFHYITQSESPTGENVGRGAMFDYNEEQIEIN